MVSMEGDRDEQLVFTQSLLHDGGDEKDKMRFRSVYFLRTVQTEPGGPLGGKISQAEWVGRSRV